MKKYTQDKLASKVGCGNKAIISEWESGYRVPSAEKIIALSEALDVPTDYLLKGVHANPIAETCEACVYRNYILDMKANLNKMDVTH